MIEDRIREVVAAAVNISVEPAAVGPNGCIYQLVVTASTLEGDGNGLVGSHEEMREGVIACCSLIWSK